MRKIQQEQLYQTQKHVNALSLEKIVKAVLGAEMDKVFQVADWRIRPLPVGMLDYARSDSHYLIPVYLMFMKILHPTSFQSPNTDHQEVQDDSPNLFFNNTLHIPDAMLLETMQAAGNNWSQNVQDIFQACTSKDNWDICDRLLSLAQLDGVHLSL